MQMSDVLIGCEMTGRISRKILKIMQRHDMLDTCYIHTEMASVREMYHLRNVRQRHQHN